MEKPKITTNIETEREVFEAWFYKEYFYHYSELDGEMRVRANAMFTGWLAKALIDA